MFLLFRNPDDAPDGELVLGGSNPKHHDGEFSYVDVVEDATHWQISMDG